MVLYVYASMDVLDQFIPKLKQELPGTVFQYRTYRVAVFRVNEPVPQTLADQFEGIQFQYKEENAQ